MDSLTIIAVRENTAAVMSLNGTLCVLMGFLGFMVGGCIILKYTLKGH